ncbi:MAG: hypothetical protein ACR2KB_12505 [Chitinophagaceae bacterium]
MRKVIVWLLDFSAFAGVPRAVAVVVCFHQQLKLSLKREMLSVVYLEASWQAAGWQKPINTLLPPFMKKEEVKGSF